MVAYYKAAYFNNFNFILLPISSLFNRGAGDFSLIAWAQTLNINTYTSTIFSCLNENAAGAATLQIYTQGGGGFEQFQFNYNGATSLLSSAYPNVATLNTWYQICVRRSGTTLNIYVNNAQVATTTSSVNINFSANYNPAIGFAKNSNNSAFFFGVIEEVSLFNRAITANELTYIYNTGAGIYADLTDLNVNNPFHNGGLIAGYHLNGDCLDFSTNALHGLFINGAYYSQGKIINPSGIVAAKGIWYTIDKLIPNDSTQVYIRLAGNDYPPILCTYYATTQTFVSEITGATFNLSQDYEWTLGY